jgi:putative PIN family toxin of toxin-antitoxin system
VRIVLDTNVVVSGLLDDASVPAQVVDLFLAGDLELAVDARIIAEYRDVLRRPELGLDPGDIDEFLTLTAFAEYVVGVPLPVSLPDPDDQPFLEVAVAGAVDALVTGNIRHFRAPEGRLNVPILTPRQLLDRMAGK